RCVGVRVALTHSPPEGPRKQACRAFFCAAKRLECFNRDVAHPTHVPALGIPLAPTTGSRWEDGGRSGTSNVRPEDLQARSVHSSSPTLETALCPEWAEQSWS